MTINGEEREESRMFPASSLTECNNDTNVQEVQNYELHLAFTVENNVVILIRNS